MSNWDFVFRYDDSAASWLAKEGYPAPEVSPGNRLPTTRELTRAWAEFDSAHEILIDDFDWDTPDATPDKAFKVKCLFRRKWTVVPIESGQQSERSDALMILR